MSGTSTQKTETENKPLPEVYELLKRRGWPEIEGLFDTPMRFFEGSTVEARSPLSAQAIDMAGQMGNQEYRQNFNQFYGDLMGGKFLTDSNPYLQDLMDSVGSKSIEQFQRGTMPGMMSRFAASGRSSSGARSLAQDATERNFAEGLQRANAEILKGDFDTRMAQMMQGLGLGSMVQGMDIADIQTKQGIGMFDEEYNRRLLGDEMQRFQFAQNEPEMRLDRFLQRLGQTTSGFGTTTQTQQVPDNTGLSIGMGLLGAASTMGGAYMAGPMAAKALALG